MPRACLRGTKFNGQEKTEKIIIKVQPKEKRVTLGIFLNLPAELLSEQTTKVAREAPLREALNSSSKLSNSKPLPANFSRLINIYSVN